MSETSSIAEPAGRSPYWKWRVCGLLLLATTINYMDRLTLSQTAPRVMEALDFKEGRLGELESAFSYAFALGGLLAGWMADRWNVRWLYPAALLIWSAAGFFTGLVNTFFALLACRFLLGIAEAGHWPCALRTTRHILPPAQRSMGNSILQSGAAVGSILTPLLILALPDETAAWRYPFLIVGAAGVVWVFLWLGSVRASDLAPGNPATSKPPIALLAFLVVLLVFKSAVRSTHENPSWLASWVPSWLPEVLTALTPITASMLVSGLGIAAVYWWVLSATRGDDELPRAVFVRRFFVLAVVVVVINGTWQFFRAWLPLFLQKGHGYSRDFTQWFSLAYYVAADIGSLASGAAVLFLARRGASIHGSRVGVYCFCAVLCTLGAVAAQLDTGGTLLAVLLVIGFASLGLFPNYYSLNQDLTSRHQGKLSGALGCTCWLSIAPLQEAVGKTVEETGSYAAGLTAAGLVPLAGAVVLILFWGKSTAPAASKPA